MTSIMEAGESMIDPQSEVRKLQDLVKKLEKQNEVLRSKQKLTTQDPNLPNGDSLKQGGINNSVFYNTKKQSEKIESVSSMSSDPLETIELIDFDKSLTDSEDSWLYTSPRPPTPQQNRVSPYKWVRQDLDHPSPALEAARRSLKQKLDEVARISRSSSTPAFSNYSTPPRGQTVAMSLSADSTPSPHATLGDRETTATTTGVQSPRIQRPMARYAGGIPASRGLDTGTFTRPKKNRDQPSQEDTSRTDDMKENVEVHHQNATDIENLAKLQEESLRQSIAQTSPRRGFRSRPLPNMAYINSELENISTSPTGSNRSSPVKYEVEGMNRRNSQSNNSVGSDNSSPPDSPYGSTQHLHPQGSGGSNLRGSLPNVSRLTVHAQHHSSDSSLADYQHEEYVPKDARLNRIQGQNQIARPSSPNVSGLKQPQRTSRGVSPQRTGLPQPTRRSIPRPGTPGKTGIQVPRRSGLPSPRASNNGNRSFGGGDSSWKEGCF